MAECSLCIAQRECASRKAQKSRLQSLLKALFDSHPVSIGASPYLESSVYDSTWLCELEIANWKSRKHLNVLLTQSIPGHKSADSFLILGSTLSRNP
jgi:hypothetical protein